MAKNELQIPLRDKKLMFQMPEPEPPRKMYSQSYRSCTTRIRPLSVFQTKQLPQIEETNPHTPFDICLIVFLVLCSSIQYGIFQYTSNTAQTVVFSNNNYQLLTDYTVICWKWLCYLITLCLIGICCNYINTYTSFTADETNRKYFSLSSKINNTSIKGNANEHKQEDTKEKKVYDIMNNHYMLSLKYFISTANFENIYSCINYDNLSSAFLSVVSTFCLFYSARFLSFGTCALISSLTSLIPLYYNPNNTGMNSSSRNRRNNQVYDSYLLPLLKVITPFLVFSGMLVANYSLIYSLTMLLCLFAIIGCQVLNRATLLDKMKTYSPFQILLSTYLNYVVVSNLLLVVIYVLMLKFNMIVLCLFGWVYIIKECLIWFILCGALYAVFSVYCSIVLVTKDLIKYIKYFEIIGNDVLGWAFFGKQMNGFIYIIGLVQSIVGLFVIENYQVIIDKVVGRKLK